MLTSTDKLRDRLEHIIARLKKSDFLPLTIKINKYFNLPISTITNYLSFRSSLEEASEFVLFTLLYELKPKEIQIFFSQEEIDTYSSAKYKSKDIKKDIEFSMIQISDRQWIGSISTDELIDLKETNRIIYNENTQRSLKHIIQGGTEYYKIFLNQIAVNSIIELLKMNLYIPNTITLNIPEDSEYKYNKKTKTLQLKNIDHLDIIDGYHRYIAFSKYKIINPDFNMNIELRLVCFERDTANQFIWQEDQKTKMRKIDSDFHNQHNNSNIIVERLNEKSQLAGRITQRGDINPAELASIIKKIYKDQNYIEVLKNLRNKLDLIVEETDSGYKFIAGKWDRKKIIAFLAATKLYEEAEDIMNSMLYIYNNLPSLNIIYANMRTKDVYSVFELAKGWKGVKS